MMVEADADKYARLHKDQRVSESGRRPTHYKIFRAIFIPHFTGVTRRSENLSD